MLIELQLTNLRIIAKFLKKKIKLMNSTYKLLLKSHKKLFYLQN